jgi:hypothetical protein
MAITGFPFEFRTLRGSQVTVTEAPGNPFNYYFAVEDKEGNVLHFSWKPSEKEIEYGRLDKKLDYKENRQEAIAIFWTAFND